MSSDAVVAGLKLKQAELAAGHPEPLRRASAVGDGTGVEWANGIDYSADSLEVMAAAQAEMTPQELRAWEKDMTVSIAEMAGIFGVSARAVKNTLTGQQAIPVAMQIACIAMRGDQTILHARFRPRVAGRTKKALQKA